VLQPVALATPATAATPSAAETAAVSTLQTLQQAAAARYTAFTAAVKHKVSFVAGGADPPPPPPPPAMMATPATTTAAVPMDTDTAAAALAASRMLAARRTQRAQLESQRAALTDFPELQMAYDTQLTLLDTQLHDLLEAQQGALEPHQLGLLVAQRQKETSEARRAATNLEAAATAQLVAHDTRTAAVNKDYEQAVRDAIQAQEAATKAMAEERTTLRASLDAQLTQTKNAHTAAAKRLESAQAALTAQTAEEEDEDAVEDDTARGGLGPKETKRVPTAGQILPMAELPKPKTIADEDLPAYALTVRVLDHHSIQDRDFPLSFSCLGIKHQAVAMIVGADVWTAAFPTTPPSTTDFIPRRVLGALKVGMTRLALAQEALQRVEDASVTSAIDAAAAAYDAWMEKADSGPSAPGAQY